MRHFSALDLLLFSYSPNKYAKRANLLFRTRNANGKTLLIYASNINTGKMLHFEQKNLFFSSYEMMTKEYVFSDNSNNIRCGFTFEFIDLK